MKKHILMCIWIAWASISSHAEPPEAPKDTFAFCQIKLLKVATDGLFHEFAEKGKKVGEINEIVYNYGLEGRPRVIFLSSHTRNPDEVCIISAETLAPRESGGVCPDYRFYQVRTTCE